MNLCFPYHLAQHHKVGFLARRGRTIHFLGCGPGHGLARDFGFMVFLPSSLWSSLTCAYSARYSDAGTTSPPAAVSASCAITPPAK